MPPTESVTDYIIRAETAITALQNTGKTLGNGLLISMVLKGLPEAFRPFAIHVAHTWRHLPHVCSIQNKTMTFWETEKLSTAESSDTVMKTQARPGRRPPSQLRMTGPAETQIWCVSSVAPKATE